MQTSNDLTLFRLNPNPSPFHGAGLEVAVLDVLHRLDEKDSSPVLVLLERCVNPTVRTVIATGEVEVLGDDMDEPVEAESPFAILDPRQTNSVRMLHEYVLLFLSLVHLVN